MRREIVERMCDQCSQRKQMPMRPVGRVWVGWLIVIDSGQQEWDFCSEQCALKFLQERGRDRV